MIKLICGCLKMNGDFVVLGGNLGCSCTTSTACALWSRARDDDLDEGCFARVFTYVNFRDGPSYMQLQLEYCTIDKTRMPPVVAFVNKRHCGVAIFVAIAVVDFVPSPNALVAFRASVVPHQKCWVVSLVSGHSTVPSILPVDLQCNYSSDIVD